MMLCYSFNNFQESNAINLKNTVTVIVYSDINSSTIVQCVRNLAENVFKWISWNDLIGT